MARPLQGNQKKISINVSVDVETKELLKKLAAEHHTSVSGLIVKLALAEENAKKVDGGTKDE